MIEVLRTEKTLEEGFILLYFVSLNNCFCFSFSG